MKDGKIKIVKREQFGNELFSISTEWNYLYLLGKIYIKHNLSLKSGVLILSDCIEVMKLLFDDKCSKYYKAKYWIGVALTSSGYKT